jgi:elongator complex protein 3
VSVDEKNLTYECCGGIEHFLSTVSGNSLIGFVRVRFPGSVFCAKLEGAALIRELHVYGSIVPLGKHGEDEERQHRSYGQKLLFRAENIAREAGYEKIAVMSGVGVRPYYRKQGYVRTGPYMIKTL